MKVLLIILPKIFLIESRQCNGKRKEKKQRKDAAEKGKSHKIKSLMGPLKSLGAPGKYPLFSPPGPDSLAKTSHTVSNTILNSS